MKKALPALYALASAVVAFIAALLFERAPMLLLGLDLRELEWISDVVLEAGGRAEEGIAWTVGQRRRRGPEAVCDRVMRLAASGRGPAGAGDWQDDRTVVVVTLDVP